MASEQLNTLTALLESIKLTPYSGSTAIDNKSPISYRYGQLYDFVKTLREQYPSVIVNPRYDRVQDIGEVSNSNKQDSNILITNPRVILSRNKFVKLTTDNAIFNGIIIDVAKGKIIAVHPRGMLMITNNDTNMVNKNEYKMYKAYDGTLVTMYFWNDKWCIASAKSVDFSDSCMFGTTKVETIIRELLAKVGLSFNDLSKTVCYSFVFTHPEWHPRAESAELYYIHSYDIDKDAPLLEIPEILKNKVKMSEEENIDELDALKAKLGEINKSTFTAGYIFRAINDNNIDYYIESAAMNILRKCIYAPSKNLRTFDQIALKNFLIDVNNNSLIALCPQFKDTFMVFDSRIDILITRIITKLYYPRGRYRNSRLETTANYFLNKVTQLVHPNNTNARNIIYDIIVNHQYYDIFESLLLQ